MNQRPNFYKVIRRKAWDLRDVVEHFNPDKSFEEVKKEQLEKRNTKTE